MKLSPCLLVLVALCVSGCARLVTDYGASDGYIGSTSLNGFGGLRSAFRQAGFSDRTITRLSQRVFNADTLVWTPQYWGPIDEEAMEWIEHWLASGDKTLVYVVPDSGSEAAYWRAARPAAAPAQRLEYRKREAASISRRIAWRLDRAEIAECGWFQLVPLEERAIAREFQGSWQAALGDHSATGTPAVGIDSLIAPLTPLGDDAARVAAAARAAVAGATTMVAGPWSPPVASRSDADLQWRALVQLDSGQTIVAELTAPPWRQSRIIVVAGGSWLTNFAITQAPYRRLAERLVQAAMPSAAEQPTAVFLSTAWSVVPVADGEQGVPRRTGMEILTVWPMSWITMHGVLIGLVICLVLFPIFGRPRRVRYTRHGDFGDHLDAVAALMNNTAGTDYARARVREYRRRFHGETGGRSATD